MRSFVRLLLCFVAGRCGLRALLTLCALLFALCPPAPAGAASPYGWVRPDGRPFVWNTSQPIPYSVDLGPLGRLGNADAVALLSTAFQRWHDVNTAAISFTQTPAPLAQDVTGANVMAFLNSLTPGVNPVLLDTDGSIMKTLLGDPAAAVALGRPLTSDPASGTITSGLLVLNGLYIDGRFNPDDLSVDDYRGMLVQEIGRFSGLGYSQLNTELILDGIPDNNRLVPQMYPMPVAGNGDQLTVDDRASVSALYPSPALASTTGTIRGQVLSNGTGLQGINVIARRVGDPTVTAVSAISGARFKNEIGPPGMDGSRQVALRGFYELVGLPPGNYTISFEALRPESMAGPRRLPAYLPGGTRYFQSATASTPDPNAASPITVTAGQVVENVNLITGGAPSAPLQDVNELEPNDFPEQAQNLVLPTRVHGSVQPGDTSGVTVPLSGGGAPPGTGGPAAVQDLYRLTLAQPTLLTATLAAANPGADLNLYLLSGPVATSPRVVAMSADAGTPPESFQLRVPAGIYFLGVSLGSGPGTAYTLEVDSTSAPDLTSAVPPKPRLNNLFVANVTPTGANTGFISDLPSNTIFYVSNPLTEFSNPTPATDHRQALSGLTPGAAYRLKSVAVSAALGIGTLPDVFFTTALPALSGGVGQISAGVADIIPDPDDPNAAFVVLSFRNVGTGDASAVTINTLNPPPGWTISNPFPLPLGLGFVGRGGSGILMTRLVRSGAPPDVAPIVTGAGTYTSVGVGQQSFSFGGAVSSLIVAKSADLSTARAGDVVTFTLVVSNQGQGAATGVVLRDDLPSVLAFVDATAGGLLQNRSVFWNLGTLAPGASGTVTFRARVDSSAANGATITNVAQVQSNEIPNPIASNVVAVGVSAPPPRLEISKSADRASARPGEIITYNIAYANDGPAGASNVLLTDTLPAGTTFVDATGVVSLSGNVVTWNVGNLAVGDTGSRLVRAQVTAGTVGGTVLTNTAQVAAAEAPAPVTSNAVSVQVVGLPQLQVAKSADHSSAGSGDLIAYSLTVSNAGSGPATNLQLSDVVPPGSSFVDAFNGGALQGGSVIWNLGTLGSGASATVSFRVQVQAAAVSAGSVSNVAQARSAEIPNPVASNQGNPVVTTISAPPQLQLSKSADRSSAQAGDLISYTLTAANSGGGPATSVQLFDAVPPGSSFVDAANGGALQGGSVIWNLGTLGPGTSATVSFRVQVQGGSAGTPSVSNVAQVRSAEIQNPVASNQGNPVVTTVATPPQLQLSKSADRTTAQLGQVISYSITAGNVGGGQATNVQIFDTIPAGTTFVDASSGGGSVGGNTIGWTIGSLATGASASVTLRVQVAGSAANGGTISNVAQVRSAELPNLVASNSANTSVVALPQLRLDKAADRTTARPGDVINFSLTARNVGGGTATNVQVYDAVPAGTNFLGADNGGGFVDAANIGWGLGALGPGSSVTVHFQVQVAGNAANGSAISNVAQVRSAELPNLQPSNQGTPVTISVQSPPQLTLSKQADRGTAGPGDTIAFTLQFRNAGPGQATGVQLTDSLPAGTTLVDAVGAGFTGSGVVWNLGTLTAGASGSRTLRVRVAGNVPGGTSITNTAQITAQEAPAAIASNPVTVTVSTQPQLQIQKGADRATRAPGDVITYTLNYANTGTGAATNVSLQDQLPANTTFVGASGGGAAFGNTVFWSVNTLQPNQTGSVTLQVRIDPNAPVGIRIDNTAQISSAEIQSPVISSIASVTTVVPPQPPHLVVTKQADVTSVAPGGMINFLLTVQNTSGGAATGVTLSDAVPAGTTAVAATSPNTFTGGVISWSVGNLAVGGSRQFTLRVQVNNSASGTITNTAQAASAEVTTPVPSNSVNVTVNVPINLTLAKAVDRTSARPGDTLTYQLTYRNAGSQTVNTVTIVDPLPANVTFLDAQNGGQLSGGAVRFDLGNLAPNASSTVSFRVQINAGVAVGTTIANLGQIGAPSLSQPVPSNSVSTTVSPPPASLTVTKQADVTSIAPGGLINFLLTVQNTGGSQAIGVTLSDPVPAGTTAVAATSPNTFAGGAVSWNVGTLAAGATRQFTLRVRVNSDASGTITNTAQTASAGAPTPVPSNSVNVTVNAPVNLSITKAVDKQSAPAGNTLTYTLTYANPGSQTIPGVVIVDPLPANVTFLDAQNGGQLNAGAVRFNLGDLGPNASGTVSFRVQINAGVPAGTRLSNQAQISAPSLPQPILSNTVMTSVSTSSPPPTQLTLHKDVDKTTASAGDTLTYTLTYTINSSHVVNGATIVDRLPAGVTFLDAQGNGMFSSGAVIFSFDSLTPNATGSVSFHVRINPGVPAGTVITNQARMDLADGSASAESNMVATTVGGAATSSFAGTWAAQAPTGNAVSLTVDPQNKLTVWAASADRQTVHRAAQGTLNADGSFGVTSSDGLVQFTGQIAADHQSASITAARAGAGSFSVTAPRLSDASALPASLVGTFNGSSQAANGDRIQVQLSIDPGGNCTFHAEVIQAGTNGLRLQSATFRVTADGRLINPSGGGQVGTLQASSNGLALTYNFQQAGTPPYQNSFQVQLNRL